MHKIQPQHLCDWKCLRASSRICCKTPPLHPIIYYPTPLHSSPSYPIFIKYDLSYTLTYPLLLSNTHTQRMSSFSQNARSSVSKSKNFLWQLLLTNWSGVSRSDCDITCFPMQKRLIRDVHCTTGQVYVHFNRSWDQNSDSIDCLSSIYYSSVSIHVLDLCD